MCVRVGGHALCVILVMGVGGHANCVILVIGVLIYMFLSVLILLFKHN